MKTPPPARLLALPLLGWMVFSACTAPPPDTPVMPPKAPSETIQSTIRPADPTPLPTPTLPQGVLLEREGAAVTLGDLPALEPGTPTGPVVVVRAAPTTPFRSVSWVLDTLHERGYEVAFQAVATP